MFLVLLTVSYYWSLLEAGLALIAACLPPLSYLFRGYSIRSVISSVRSTLSLHSLSMNHSHRRSEGSRDRSQVHDGYDLSEENMKHNRKDSKASEATMLGKPSTEGEGYMSGNSGEHSPVNVFEFKQSGAVVQ